jgi:hypothetical protein
LLERKYVDIEDLLNVYDYLQYKQHHIPGDLVLSSVFLLDKDGDRGSTVVKVLCYKSDKRRIVWILRIDPAHIPPDWTTRPQFRLWPTERHRAVLWILAQMAVAYPGIIFVGGQQIQLRTEDRENGGLGT